MSESRHHPEETPAYESLPDVLPLLQVKDGMGMMRTIAKIRNLHDGERAVGFDAGGERTLGAATKSGRRGSGGAGGRKR